MANELEKLEDIDLNEMSETERLLLIRSIINDLTRAFQNSRPNEISVNNLDEIKLHLRTELEVAVQKIEKILPKIELPSLPELKIAETVKISNLSELDKSLQELRDSLKLLNEFIQKINFEPKIDVNVPDVIVPPITVPDIKIPPIKEPKVTFKPVINFDIDKLLAALEPLEYLSDDPTAPISVRLSDGKKFIAAIQALVNKQDKVIHAFASSTGISKDEYKEAVKELGLNAKGILSHKIANITETASQVTVTAGKKSMIIQNAGSNIVYIGGSSVTSTNYAFALVPRQMFEFGAVQSTFNFYAICAAGLTSTIGVGEYA
jgi:hypothetical protein